MNAERERIIEAGAKRKHWRRWGPYLSERQWGTVREDYSPYGSAWTYFPHDHARSRAYRWGEDGLCGICDNHQRICFAIALWNGKDPILKERIYGLAGPEGNHGEDAKEYWYYLDSTPTHSYMRCLYKYPQAEFPYEQLAHHGRDEFAPELELADTGVFAENRYWDIFVEYAKAGVDDLLIRIKAVNRGPEAATLHLLPTVWFRNTWSWGGRKLKPEMRKAGDARIDLEEDSLGAYQLVMDGSPKLLFTENETNTERLYGFPNGRGFYKDAFHEAIIHGRDHEVSRDGWGTKACAQYVFEVPPGEERTVNLRLSPTGSPVVDAPAVFAQRIAEADEFYNSFQPAGLSEDAKNVQRQAFAGLLWSKQFYHYSVEQWLDGDSTQPSPPRERKRGRNRDWTHLFNEDVISMPDKWEYPWYAAWDLAFHTIPLAMIDPEFAKSQLALFLREWYMHPNGQLPAYEWAFGDVNPPVHAWACWRVYKIDAKLQGRNDTAFLESVFHKLLMNFTWWVNRKDSEGNNIFEGGFLGLDNIGIFDRSKPIPGGGTLEQSDGTSWMAMFCLNMLKIATELAMTNPVYEDVASKFFEHFLYIASAMNRGSESSLWDEGDGFYYDTLSFQQPDGSQRRIPTKVRSMVGLIPLFAVDTLDPAVIDRLPGFRRRLEWFIKNRPDLCENVASMTLGGKEERRLLSIVPRGRLERVLQTMLDENEFLSPFGLRSVSHVHKDKPYELRIDGQVYRVDYEPAESTTGLFGGNSNWRGPIWFPVNYLMIESLQKFNHYFGNDLKVEFPSGSGHRVTLGEVAQQLSIRLARIFLQEANGRRPVFGGSELNEHILFYEYFHGDNGAGLGASHQTGWTGLVAKLLQQSGE
ncbi:MAG: glucosidase [Candidatus Solibacter usitatus]|nr:glucosidase [Candidatus Solibacter usitatus]